MGGETNGLDVRYGVTLCSEVFSSFRYACFNGLKDLNRVVVYPSAQASIGRVSGVDSEVYRPRMWVHLFELHLVRGYRIASAVEDEKARTRRPLVDRANEPRFEFLFVLCKNLLMFGVLRHISGVGIIIRASHGVAVHGRE